jgi:hypothetical protein
MAKKSSSTALMFNPFGGALTKNPRRNMGKYAGGAIGVGIIAAVAAIVGAGVGSTAQLEATGTDFFSKESLKSKAIVGGTAGVAAALITVGLMKLA